MLDSGPMYNWHKLLVVVLLMLSLSARAFAGASLDCEISQPSGKSPSVIHETMVHISESSLHGDEDMGVTHHHFQHSHDGFHHNGGAHCVTCASCCFSAALPSVAVIATPTLLVRDVAAMPPSTGAIRFLTDGIERPPRVLLV